MLRDRTNNPSLASPSVSKSLNYYLGIDTSEKDSPRRATISGFIDAESSAQPSVVEAEDEDLKALKAEFESIQVSARYDQTFGDMTERTAYDTTVLKRQPPDQKIFGYPAEYLKQETGRLGEGFKKIRGQRDNLLREVLDVSSKQETAFSKLFSVITKMKQDKTDVQRKVTELEKRLRAEMIQSEKAKLALGKESEQVSRAELAFTEAKSALSDCEKQCADAEARERDARKRAENAERLAQAQLEELDKLRDELMRTQLANQEAVKSQAEELQAEIERWKRKQRMIEQDIQAAETRIEDLSARLNIESQSLDSSKAENQRKEVQVDAMRERASNAEGKVNDQDGSVNLALATLRESQEVIQSRVENLAAEKTKLENKVNDMEAEKRTMMDRVYEAQLNLDRIHARDQQLTIRVLELENALMDINTAMGKASNELETSRIELLTKSTKHKEAKDQLESCLLQINDAKASHGEKTKQSTQLKLNITKMETELSALRRTLDKLSNSPKKMEKVLEESKEAESLKRKMGDAEYFREKMEQLEMELEGVRKQLFDADTQRRALLNEVHGLKGNIQVICRVRPSMKNTNSGLRQNELSQLTCSVDGMGLSLELRGDHKKSATAQEVYPFSFNRVFDSEASQHIVFDEVSSFVQSALDGYNVCLFSYGQSGTGKSWTMMGDLTNHLNRGIIPRSLEFILRYVTGMREKGWIYDVDCTYIEVYNETIRDLLVEDPNAERTARHDILHRGGNIIITGVRKAKLQDPDEAQLLLEQAEALRTGPQSSNAHAVFTIHLLGRNAGKGDTELSGSLTLCDLAGSEQLASPSSPNQGLSALISVFSAMAQKNTIATIPFKSSNLTHILSPCLGGEGKTMMILNVSPDHDDADESLTALRFAQQVNKTELSKSKKPSSTTAATGSSTNTAVRGRNNSSQ